VELACNLGIFVWLCVVAFSQWLVWVVSTPFPEARLAGAVYAACTTEAGSTDERRRIPFDGGYGDPRLPHPPDQLNLHGLRVSPDGVCHGEHDTRRLTGVLARGR
jgi:hypothetical protein